MRIDGREQSPSDHKDVASRRKSIATVCLDRGDDAFPLTQAPILRMPGAGERNRKAVTEIRSF
jgi:hypothetical protein